MSLPTRHCLVQLVCVVSCWVLSAAIRVDVDTNEPLGPSGSFSPSPRPYSPSPRPYSPSPRPYSPSPSPFSPSSAPLSSPGDKGYSHTFVASPGVRKYTYGITHDPEGDDFSIKFNPLDTDVDMDNFVHEPRGFKPAPQEYRQQYVPDFDEIQLKVNHLSHKEMEKSNREVQGVHQEFGRRPLQPTKSSLIIHAPKPIAFEEMDLGLMGYGDFMDSYEHESSPTPQPTQSYSPRPSPFAPSPASHFSPTPTPGFKTNVGPTAYIRPSFGSPKPELGLGAYANGGTPKPLGLGAYSTPKPLGFSGLSTPKPGFSTPQSLVPHGLSSVRPYKSHAFSTPKPFGSYVYSTSKPQGLHGFSSPKPSSHAFSTPRPLHAFSTPKPLHAFSTPKPLSPHAFSTPVPSLHAHGSPKPTPIIYKPRPTPIRFQQQPQVKFPSQQSAKVQFPKLHDQRLVKNFKPPKLQYGFKPIKGQKVEVPQKPLYKPSFDEEHLDDLADKAFSKVFMSHNHNQEMPMVFTQHNHNSHKFAHSDVAKTYLVPVVLMPSSDRIPSDAFRMNYHNVNL